MNTINYMGLDIPLDNKEAYIFLSGGKNLRGVFQMETHSASKTLTEIQPKNIEDLSLCNALNRPGCFKFTQNIGSIRRGEEQIEYLHPALEPFLKDTYGFLIYQESVLQIAQQMAGFTPIQSSVLLKALGKKLTDKMLSLQDSFIKGMESKGFSKDIANKIFSWFIDFADYSFNKSHSVAYSLQGYCSAYIKMNYPLEFFTSALNFSQYEQKPLEEIFDYVSELPDFNIQLLPPSIHKVSNKFAIEGQNIRYPLGLIKGLGDKLYPQLEVISPSQLTTFDACIQTLINSGLNSRSIEAIIMCGALDDYKISREDALLYFWFLSDLQPEILEKFWIFKNGSSFSIELINNFLNYRVEEPIGKKGKIKIKSYFKTEITRQKTLKQFEEYISISSYYKQNSKLCYYIWEMNSLGYSLHYGFSNKKKTYSEMQNMDDNNTGDSFGFVEEVMNRRSDKGNEYGIYVLKFDKRERFIFFGDNYSFAKNLIKEGDFISFSFQKEAKGYKILSVKNVNNEIRKCEFYKKDMNKSNYE